MELHRPELFVNIERYQRINIMAKTPEAVYPESGVLAVENNLGFLRQCIEKIKLLDFIDPETEKCYLSVNEGKFHIEDQSIFDTQILDVTFLVIIAEIAPEILPEM